MAGAGGPLLALHGLGLRHAGAEAPALAGLNLALGDGEFLSVVGPSGCGKSSLLRLLAGLATPSEGRVERAAGDAAIGCVFQDPTLMPWASVFDNVWLPLRLAGRTRQEAAPAVQEALARVGLASVADALPHVLSGGMRMRASIARALVTRPRLLLLDEPFAALDETTRERLGEDLLAIWREQAFAAVFVTHNVDEAVALAQRVAVMAARPGRIVATIEAPATLARGASGRETAEHVALCTRVRAALRDSEAAHDAR